MLDESILYLIRFMMYSEGDRWIAWEIPLRLTMLNDYTCMDLQRKVSR